VNLASRARVHAALADPQRLAIVDALALGDRTPRELGELVGAPTNLLAHHLGVLDGAGLIERRASSGDGRRRYVVLRPDPLATLVPAQVMRATTVLFVCTHNSARSQFAAALWRRRTGAASESAGADPAAKVHPSAVRAARRLGVDLAGAAPKGYEAVAVAPDLVVSVCDRAREAGSPFDVAALHWSVPDPVADGRAAAFTAAFHDISQRIERLAAARPAA
jgi:ArsR family transcriptional regulator, arsenate/arsenite/antimonite-responsive transcriptional repressor / arsenate reductase (thioredoxin)